MMPDLSHPLAEGGDILVVEDTLQASLRLLTSLLDKAKLPRARSAGRRTGPVDARAQPPELILLDVRMPGMDGYQVCRALKQSPELREVPVIFLSAFDDTDDKLRGFDAGAVDFISKPYHFLEVKARVSAHLEAGAPEKLLAWQNDNLQQLVETKAE
ncbi:response regulator [Massilia sp. B-10]|nr:response regulator [Massilia sp. B-10]